LHDAGRVLVADGVLDSNEAQRATLARLALHLEDAADALHLPAYRYRGQVADAAAGPHAARQLDRRQETTACGVTILAKFAPANGRIEEQPLPARRQRLPFLGTGIEIERRCHGGDGRGVDLIV